MPANDESVHLEGGSYGLQRDCRWDLESGEWKRQCGVCGALRHPVGFVLKREEKANGDAIKQMKGIIGVVSKGGQFQVVIGGKVTDVFRELMKLADFETSQDSGGEKEAKEKRGDLEGLWKLLRESFFSPLLPSPAAVCCRLFWLSWYF